MGEPLNLLCADLGLLCYENGFTTCNTYDIMPAKLAALGRKLVEPILGTDQGVGNVNFGFISDGPDGMICTIRGTQCPGGSYVEWLDDFDAVLEPITWCPGASWHRGFGDVYQTLNVATIPLGKALGMTKNMLCHGHSLGGPLATYAAAQAGTRAPILYASPKPGDSNFRAFCRGLWGNCLSYANPNDAVPKVPITVDWPIKVEDFVQVAPLIEMSPSSVTPPIPADWGSSHQLSNYRRLIVQLNSTLPASTA